MGGDRMAKAFEIFASSLNYTQTQRSLEDLTYQINEMKSHVTDLPKASLVEEQLQTLCNTIMEELNEVKTDNHHLLSTFEDQNQTISAKNDQNDSRMVQLITNQEIIIKKQCEICNSRNSPITKVFSICTNSIEWKKYFVLKRIRTLDDVFEDKINKFGRIRNNYGRK